MPFFGLKSIKGGDHLFTFLDFHTMLGQFLQMTSLDAES